MVVLRKPWQCTGNPKSLDELESFPSLYTSDIQVLMVKIDQAATVEEELQRSLKRIKVPIHIHVLYTPEHLFFFETIILS